MDERAKQEFDSTTVKLKSYPYQKKTNKKLAKLLSDIYQKGGSAELAIAKGKELLINRREGLIKRLVKDLIVQFKLIK